MDRPTHENSCDFQTSAVSLLLIDYVVGTEIKNNLFCRYNIVQQKILITLASYMIISIISKEANSLF